MTKHEFVSKLKDALSGLPQGDAAERIAFYVEIIDDRIEDGTTEEEAVAAAGSIDDIAEEIIAHVTQV